jgi:hypothetical protein
VPIENEKATLIQHIWLFTGGAILILLQSMVSDVKRRWTSLLAGCVYGGAGAVVGWGFLQDLHWNFYATLFLAGVAAVVCENVLAGVLKTSRQFADSPIKVASYFARMFLPTFGKSVGDADADKDGLK